MTFDLDGYLRRIGLDRAHIAAADRAGLAALDAIIWHHVTTIPFENLEPLQGRPIAIDVGSVFAQLVTARRGGYCFQHNTLLAAALAALGYRVTPLAARVGTAQATASRTHMLLEVELGGGAHYLADVGFGADTPTAAIPLALGAHATRNAQLELRAAADGHWVLQQLGARADTLYWFTREPQHPVDYEVANYYTSTHPRSFFAASPRLALVTADGHRGYTAGQLTIRRGEHVERTPVAAADFVAMLAREFTLMFPADAKFRGVD